MHVQIPVRRNVDVNSEFPSLPPSWLYAWACMEQYLRLMVIWTALTAFSGLFQSLLWLERKAGSRLDGFLVRGLLAVSMVGMIGNVSTAA